MNYQERKQWLERYRACMDRIEELQDLQRQARDNAEKITPTTGETQQAGNVSKVEKAVVTIRAADDQIKALQAAARAYKREILLAVNPLSPRLSGTATAHFIQGVSTRDIARITGKTKRAIEKRIQNIILYAKIPGA